MHNFVLVSERGTNEKNIELDLINTSDLDIILCIFILAGQSTKDICKRYQPIGL